MSAGKRHRCIANAYSFVFLAKFFVGSWSTLSRLELGADEGNIEIAEAKSTLTHTPHPFAAKGRAKLSDNSFLQAVDATDRRKRTA